MLMHYFLRMMQVIDVVGLPHIDVVMEDSPSRTIGTSPNEASLNVVEEVMFLVDCF